MMGLFLFILDKAIFRHALPTVYILVHCVHALVFIDIASIDSKLLSLFTVANSEGKEIDQGTMLRYLAEIAWFPTAVINDYITWEELDDHNAKATIDYGDVTASGVFTINDRGEVIRFEAERYGEFDGEFRLEPWSIIPKDYKAFEGEVLKLSLIHLILRLVFLVGYEI